MALPNLPSEDHVIRHVPPSKLRRDEDDVVIGCNWHAFERRPGEEAVSVTWLEHFGGVRESQLLQAVNAVRRQLDVKNSAGFAIAHVQTIHDTCATLGEKVRVVHEPEPQNSGHSSIRPPKDDTQELLELLAAEAFAELVIASTIPSLPVEEVMEPDPIIAPP